MAINPNITCANRGAWTASFIAANALRAKILVDHSPGGLVLPDSSSFPANQPQITRGGQRIIGGSIASSDGTAKDVLQYIGTTLTTQSTVATGALAVATTSTITRATGDFRLDDWKVGEALMIFGAGPTTFGGVGTQDYSNNAGTLTALSSSGVIATITAVSATTLTVNGTPLTVESLAGCRLIRVVQDFRQTVAFNSGNAAATASVKLIGGTNQSDVNNLLAADQGISLGATEVYIVAMQAAVSALPARIDFNAKSVLF